MAREGLVNGNGQAMLLKLLSIAATLLAVIFGLLWNTQATYVTAIRADLKEVRTDNEELRERITRLEGLLRAPAPMR